MNPPRSRIALQLAAMLALVLVLLISVSTLFALRSLNEANHSRKAPGQRGGVAGRPARNLPRQPA